MASILIKFSGILSYSSVFDVLDNLAKSAKFFHDSERLLAYGAEAIALCSRETNAVVTIAAEPGKALLTLIPEAINQNLEQYQPNARYKTAHWDIWYNCPSTALDLRLPRCRACT